MPGFCKPAWYSQEAVPGCRALQTLMDIHALQASSTYEYSGCIGPDWFSLMPGEEDCAPFLEGLFVWHSHVGGDPLFSLDDLALFLYSRAIVMALFVPSGMAIAIKSLPACHIAARLRKNFKIIPSCPLLTMQKLFNQLSLLAGSEARELPGDILAARLGLGLFIEYI